MRLVASGLVFDTRHAPDNERSASATSAFLTSDGTLLVTFRLGTERESGDGHAAVLATPDRGATWELRYLGLGDRSLERVAGEQRSFQIAELTPGELTASVLWIDRSDPSKPWVNQETQGLLPMRNYQTTSRDGGYHWSPPRPIDLSPHPSASTTGPLIALPDGVLAQPFEHWKAYDDPAQGRPRAMLRLSHDGGQTWHEDVVVAADPDNRLFFWDQRLARNPDTGELVAMFWTFDREGGADVANHIAWGSPDGRTWTVPQPTPMTGQHCQPISLGGSSLVAAYSHRRNPPGIRVVRSDDFGRTWDVAGEVEAYASGAGHEPNAEGGSQIDYWNAMGQWQFGHPRGVHLPGDSPGDARPPGASAAPSGDASGGEVFIVFYAGEGATRSARWARIQL